MNEMLTIRALPDGRWQIEVTTENGREYQTRGKTCAI